jgi:hypothetical protein
VSDQSSTPSKADEIWNEFTRTNNDGIAIFAFPKALSAIRQLERELAIAKKRLWIELEAPTTIGTQSAGR